MVLAVKIIGAIALFILASNALTLLVASSFPGDAQTHIEVSGWLLGLAALGFHFWHDTTKR